MGENFASLRLERSGREVVFSFSEMNTRSFGAGLPTPPKRPTAGLLFNSSKTVGRTMKNHGQLSAVSFKRSVWRTQKD